jgi:hypothetical protein
MRAHGTAHYNVKERGRQEKKLYGGSMLSKGKGKEGGEYLKGKGNIPQRGGVKRGCSSKGRGKEELFLKGEG